MVATREVTVFVRDERRMKEEKVQMRLPDNYYPDTKDKHYRSQGVEPEEFHSIGQGQQAMVIGAILQKGAMGGIDVKSGSTQENGNIGAACRVAAKRYTMSELKGDKSYRWLMREMQNTQFLVHPNIVRLEDTFFEPNADGTVKYTWIVTERMETTLQAYINHINRPEKMDKPRDHRHVAAVMTQIFMALDFLHHRGVIHRMSVIRPEAVIGLLAKNFGCIELDLSEEETKFAHQLQHLLVDALTGDLQTTVQEELFRAEDTSDDEDEPYEMDDRVVRPIKAEKNGFVRFGDKQASIATVKRAIAYYRLPASKTRPMSSMASRFRFLSNRSHMDKLRQLEEQDHVFMDRNAALKRLTEIVSREVNQKLDEGLPLHGRNLRAIVMELNEQHKLVKGFLASPSWIHKLKRHLNLCSRSITKFVSTKTRRDEALLDAKVDALVTEMRALIVSEGADNVINCDQSGLLKEHLGKHTLAKRGTKKVEVCVQRTTDVSHSSTYMPIVTASGRLYDKAYLLFAEPSGSIPPNANFFRPPNLIIDGARSHMMTRKHTEDFIRDVLCPQAPRKFVALLDNWSCFRNHGLIHGAAPPGTDIQIKNIPSGGTGLMQPLDQSYFRHFKIFQVRIDEEVLLYKMPFQLGSRDGIAKITSVIHHQMGADLFTNLRLTAWSQSGMIDPPDLNPKNVGLNLQTFDIKLLDFGCSGLTVSDGSMTTKGRVGTPHLYRPPELLVPNCPYDSRVDVWAVGLIALEMLGKKLFLPSSIPNPEGVEKDKLFSAYEAAMLQRVLDVLGVPEDRYEEVFGNHLARMDERPSKLREELQGPLGLLGPEMNALRTADLENLLYKIFTVNPQRRPTATNCLRHPYLVKMHEKYKPTETRGSLEADKREVADMLDRFSKKLDI
ncbi:unnamed protein product, partial [Mesorhabditis spiculigera]